MIVQQHIFRRYQRIESMYVMRKDDIVQTDALFMAHLHYVLAGSHTWASPFVDVRAVFTRLQCRKKA